MKISKIVATAIAEKIINLLNENKEGELQKITKEIEESTKLKQLLPLEEKITFLQEQLNILEEEHDILWNSLNEDYPEYKIYRKNKTVTVKLKTEPSSKISTLTNDIIIANHVNNIEADKLIEYFVNLLKK